ncbi:LysR family transcriptional regulator [Marinobacterium sedimentorum]|uniref:LysR family transcriptional regulator n=1 Tax=Marinobacterium sedimentorum TaxID=2927804 RepID=UPI0020C6C93C|nr:LysR family transcriptional regulator [Marinobacterium sedimentorum]MCP8689361.1 LysR family transcriptional regulator [Marinobacterium sedimentorum]
MQAGITEFVAVAQAGSFTAAAQALETSKSRLSQAVSRLEKELGVTLLQRTTRRISLTDVGDAFYRQCRQGLDLLRLAVDDAQTQQQQMTGTIRINSVGGILGEQWLSPILLRFMALYPQIRVDLDFSSHRVDLSSDPFDLVVRMGELPDSSLIARPLQQLESIVCASPDFIARHGMVQHPDALSQLPAALGSLTRYHFSRVRSSDAPAQQQDSIEWHASSHLRCRNGHVMKQAALQGTTFTILPRIYLQAALERGTLVQLLPDWALKPAILSLVYPQHRYRLRRVELLVDFLTEELRKPIRLPSVQGY